MHSPTTSATAYHSGSWRPRCANWVGPTTIGPPDKRDHLRKPPRRAFNAGRSIVDCPDVSATADDRRDEGQPSGRQNGRGSSGDNRSATRPPLSAHGSGRAGLGLRQARRTSCARRAKFRSRRYSRRRPSREATRDDRSSPFRAAGSSPDLVRPRRRTTPHSHRRPDA